MSGLAQLVSSARTDMGDSAPRVTPTFRSRLPCPTVSRRAGLTRFPALRYARSGTTGRVPPRIRLSPPPQPTTRTADTQTSRSVALPSGPRASSES